MKKMPKNFLPSFTLAVLIILCIAMVGSFLTGDSQITNMIVTAFVGTLGAATGFYFRSDNKNDDDK